MKILMVCLGNICRSPLAEGLLMKHLQKSGEVFEVDSAGTGNWHSGEPPDTRSIGVAARFGLDISTQRARQITIADFDHYDFIFTMDESVQRDVMKMLPRKELKDKVHLLRIYAGDDASLVPDPYYEGEEAFTHVYQLLDKACEKAAARLLTLLREQKSGS